MIREDEHALICDMAETYHIYDYKALRPSMAAILAVGLPADSRIKRKLAGQRYDTKTLLLACIADSLNILVWFNSKDGQNNTNRPKSILSELTGEKEQEELEAYDSIEAYEAARKKIMES